MSKLKPEASTRGRCFEDVKHTSASLHVETNKHTCSKSALCYWISSPVGRLAKPQRSEVGRCPGCLESTRLHTEVTEVRHASLRCEIHPRVIDLLIVRGRS